ncbi:oleate hydratase, partial [Staphylococcus aureus]|nr:oleate hydratase [Staphylococcus aureus]
EDIDFKDAPGITATALHLSDGSTIKLGPDDDVIMTNACMTDSATLGDMNTPAPKPEEKPISGELWYKVAQKKPNLG